HLILVSSDFLTSSPFISTPTTKPYTPSLHDALPISAWEASVNSHAPRSPSLSQSRISSRIPSWNAWHISAVLARVLSDNINIPSDRKSTRLNSSHVAISYAVFCLKKKKQIND